MADQILLEQVDYYRARANEYDEWFMRQGRYDRGSEHRAAWFTPEVIAINRRRVQSNAVEYVVADLFAWQPQARFDAVLVSWLERLDSIGWSIFLVWFTHIHSWLTHQVLLNTNQRRGMSV